ncbi:MAG: hypothetical protein ABI611_19615 [Solirubrobacteraceae bacterium]
MLGTRELVAELESLLVDPLIVVLDDAERLHGASGATQLIAALVGPHARLRVAVVSRRELPLKAAKLRARGELTVLRGADLAFTSEECARLLSTRFGREPLADEVAHAMEATGGWALGIDLGAASGEPFARGRESQRATFEYLAEEVLAAVDPRLREQLLDSSLPPDLSPALIESLGLPRDFLEQAQGSGLFVRELEPAREVYAYHPLFRDFLQDNLRRRRSDAELRRMHRLVARGLAASARVGESVDHWLQAWDWQAAIEAMAEVSPELRRTSPATLHAWLERLPPAVRQEPSCLLIEGQLAANDGHYERAGPLLREAVAANRRAGDVGAEWTARAALCAVLFSAGAARRWIVSRRAGKTSSRMPYRRGHSPRRSSARVATRCPAGARKPGRSAIA